MKLISKRLSVCKRHVSTLPSLAVVVAVLLCSAQALRSNEAQASISASGSAGSSGAGGASISGSADASISGGGSGSSVLGGGGGGGGGTGSSGASLSASGSASASGDAQSPSSSSSASASLSLGASLSTTPKPEGSNLLGKVKEIFRESKEVVKSSVESLTGKDDKKSSSSLSASASGSISPGSGSSASTYGSSGGSGSLSASASGKIDGDSSAGSAQASAHLSMQGGEQKEGGLIDKLSDMAKKGKETIKETASELKEKAKEVKDDLKQAVGLGDDQKSSIGGSIKIGGMQASANINMKGSSSGGGRDSGEMGNDQGGNVQHGELPEPLEKVQKFVNKGTEKLHESMHRIEDKVTEVSDKVKDTLDENLFKPMSQVQGSGQQLPEGRMTARAEASMQLRGEERDRYLMEVKRKQERELGQRPGNVKEIIARAKSQGIIPKNEDRSVLLGNHADEKSVAVEVLDKVHEISKMPVERVLKPLDKIMGYEKDPLIRMYDNTHEIVRRPLSLMSKPVESMLNGAFKTSDEAKRDQERLLETSNEQERREFRLREERKRREDRSVVGEIADRTIELAEKPFEIILKPVDHLLGLDKDGQKNPLLRLIDELYGLSKKPVDAIAKPLESILRKMADEEGEGLQVSLRFNARANSNQAGAQASARLTGGQQQHKQQSQSADYDPKLFTRLADGALNIADRVITRPLEVVMKPLNHALGYSDPGKKNPILEAAHSLKNATKLGAELFTRPIDRIIRDIAEIGAIKDEAEREAMLERRRDEASRIVRALDRLHELAQSPFEIVLRPVDRALGINKHGRKEPFLRAWDVIHQVLRAPIQVLSKPVEDALLGEQPPRHSSRQQQQQQSGRARAHIGGQIGGIKAGASVNLQTGSSSDQRPDDAGKRNIIVESIKKVERLAAKPLDVVTSPIRKLILGEDDEKQGTTTEKLNRLAVAKAQGKAANGKIREHSGPDKIVKVLESMNNVALKPLEVLTQPISDILSPDDNKQQRSRQQQQQQQSQHQNRKLDVKVQGNIQTGSSQSGESYGQRKEMSASAQAQIKKSR